MPIMSDTHAHFVPGKALSDVSYFGYCDKTLSFTKCILRNHIVKIQKYQKKITFLVNSCRATFMAILGTCNPEEASWSC